LPLNLDLAGVPVAVDGLDGGFARDAARRYHRFGSDAAPELRVRVRPAVGDHRPEGTAVVTRSGADRYEMSFGAMRGTVDLQARTVEAELPDSVFVLDSLLRISMTLVLLPRRALLLHSCGVKHGDDALVCFGPSGAGKTTVAKMVRSADVLCDEIMALRVGVDGSVTAHGTPFQGELGICSPGRGPLAALCRLHQTQEPRLSPLSTAAAAREVLAATLFFCNEPDLAEQLLDLAATICIGRTFSLEFALTTHVPDFVFAHLRGNADAPHPKTARPPTGR
jgi:hypothetical protein